MIPLNPRSLTRDLTNMIGAARDAVFAFFRAYDEEFGTDALGYPTLANWSESPYESYFRGVRSGPDAGAVRAALVFVHGQRPGEAIYLRDGQHRLGTACTNDVLIHVPTPTEAKMNFQIGEDATLVSSDLGETPVLINRHVSQYVTLVDQDECSFNGAQFYYVTLPSAPVGGPA